MASTDLARMADEISDKLGDNPSLKQDFDNVMSRVLDFLDPDDGTVTPSAPAMDRARRIARDAKLAPGTVLPIARSLQKQSAARADAAAGLRQRHPALARIKLGG